MPLNSSAPMRVCIYARVTDIPGNPLNRAETLGQEFCRQIIGRPFQSKPMLSGYDHDHIPPSFDSPNPVSIWFVYDFNVTTELAKEQLNDVEHLVYFASRQRTGELEFLPRDGWVDKAKERAKMYTWGGREEQEWLHK